MSRKRITEYTAKKILYPYLDLQLKGASINTLSAQLDSKQLSKTAFYVVKVDQGIKKRMKKGLVKVNVKKSDIDAFIADKSKEYAHFFAEEFVEHTQQDEKYLSLERVREGYMVYYSNQGGIDIEDNTHTIQKALIKDKDSVKEIQTINDYLSLPSGSLMKVIEAFDKNFFSFLEINPFVVKDGPIHILDLAVEVDSTAEFFVNKAWSSHDFVDHFSQHKTEEERIVAKLAQESQAAFSLEVLNEDGSFFVLLSGGGASLVIADEVYNLRYGKELGNYGEYSGNPNAEETYLYTKAVLSLLLRSKSDKKVLIIGGGVANFTDVRITFKGVVKALQEREDDLKKQDITIFVRRGGPHQKEGLQMISNFLKESIMSGEVYGPDIVLTEVVKKSIEVISK
ncbi:MAG: ATP citrate lyase citrate-binding domain-containing protein [Patescibacteria group bacterium]